MGTREGLCPGRIEQFLAGTVKEGDNMWHKDDALMDKFTAV